MKRVLVIDDSDIVLNLVKATLENAGYEVTALTHPGDLAAVIEREPPDLVLVDVNMPEFFGDDVVSYFKDAMAVSAPIYLFSNVPEEELRERASACGADGYISKEWGLELLISSVGRILSQPSKSA